ncbi:hypothetical protein CSB20_00915 [bacterium DOLZORAL124_64_63]|nr:MAG: hypothetical protein CSB20_00915 [bacterium DOLZORAL124_64_63]
MFQQRNRPRKNTPHTVRVVDAGNNKSLGRVVDITADGMMLVGKKSLAVGQRLALRIILPQLVDGKMEITIQSEVVWSQQDNNPSFFKAGIRFLNLPGNDGFLLEDVLHRMTLIG